MRAVLVGCTQFRIVGKELLHIAVMPHALLQIIYIDLRHRASLKGTIVKDLCQAIQHIINVFCVNSLEKAFKLLEFHFIWVRRLEIPKSLARVIKSTTGLFLLFAKELAQ